MNQTCMPEPRMKTAPDRSTAGHNPVVQFVDVTREYLADGEVVHALNRVDLEIEGGEFVALVGRSGCGKSTLLNLAGAMDFPTSGEVCLDGKSTSLLGEAALTALRRQKVGFIFQSFQLLHTLSVIENVELPLLLAGKSNARAVARERLEWVELQDLGKRLPHQLSGGQMQRVAIARALVHAPRLILADEPTGNLDTTTGNTILDLLRRISSEVTASVIMATHSTEAAAIADKVLHMRDGRIHDVAVR
jgi:putative ABC transport system ATP-binding protein